MAGLAEVAGNPNDSFWTWRDLMYRLVGKISPEQLGVIARQLYIEMLKAGYTSVAEFHYVHHDTSGQPYADPAELALRISQAASSAGIGLTLLPVLYSHAGFGGQTPNDGQRRFINSTENYLKLQSRLQPILAQQPAQSLGLCFHSLRAVTPQQISEVLAASDKQCPVHIHIAEQQKLVPGPRHPRQPGRSHGDGQESRHRRPVPDHRGQPGRRDFPGRGFPRPRRAHGHRFRQPRVIERGGRVALAGIRPASA
jgi:formimidoylglutamate deiminase